jgi:hypothetical protein
VVCPAKAGSTPTIRASRAGSVRISVIRSDLATVAAAGVGRGKKVP